MAVVESNIADRATHENAFTLGNALVHALPVTFQAGDLAAAERLSAMLLDTAVKYALTSYHAWARSFQAWLLIEHGELDVGLQRMEAVLEELRGIAFVIYYLPQAAAFAEGLGRAGRTREGLAAIEDAIAQCERTEELWCLPELLRLKGDLVAQDGAPGCVQAAERCFIRSLDLARCQQALSWELRTATSLARLHLAEGRPAEARAALAPVHDRFSEGFARPDLMRAAALLKEIGAA
jgi:predicted ATPase